MYAIVKTGGKQYRVQEGESLLVERLPAGDGESVSLQPLLVVDGPNVVDGDDLTTVDVQARVVGHVRGPKLRVVKFKPKRGYKRRTGHRQELTRIEVTKIMLAAGRSGSSAPKEAEAPAEPAPEMPEPTAAPEATLEPPAPEATQNTTPTPEAGNGA